MGDAALAAGNGLAGGGARTYALRLIGVGGAYFVLAKAGLALASIHPSATPIWPPTGLALAALLLWGYRVWPAIFAGAFLANALTAGSLASSAGIAFGNTLEAVVGAYLLVRWSGGPATFDTPLGVGRFALASLGPGTMLSATIGVTSLALGGYADWAKFGPIWTTWWIGDLAGAIVVTPVIVLWARGGRGAPAPQLGSALLFAAAAAIGIAAFSPLFEQTADRGAIAFIAVIPLLWAALRHGPRETASVALILSAAAVWGTLLGGGPFARATLNESFLLLLAFMLSASIPSLALSADTQLRRRREHGLRRARADSEEIVRARTAELVGANAALEAALAELRQQRLHLLEAQRLAKLGSWSWEVADNRVTWSETLFEIFGLRPEQFAGTYEDFLSHVHESDRAHLREVIETACREGGEFRVDERIVRPDGEIRYLQGSGRAIADQHGRTVRLLGVCQDVTQERRARHALEEARQALQQAQKMEALGQLTGGIAHDFNNTLTAISNSLDLMRPAVAGDAAQLERLERALQAARNGAALVRQLLVFARKQPVQLQSGDVNRIVRSTMEMFARSASENIEIATDFDPALLPARVDATQLQTTLLNLAVNARDAMPSGGTIRIATRNVAAEDPGAGRGIEITVTDTGMGMPPEVLARAFEPFFTTKELGKGTGLGLSMVYSAIRQMDGDVSIESEPDRGTTVRLRLPAADEAAERARPQRVDDGGAAPAVPDCMLLYVEDEALVRMATVDLMQSAGYWVLAAPDARQALALLDREPRIGVMVTDIGLPGMNGYDLAAEARRRRPGLRVLFLTGYDRDKSADAQRDPSALYLDKPYEPRDLFEALGRLARA